jgi:WD40 repeat protein
MHTLTADGESGWWSSVAVDAIGNRYVTGALRGTLNLELPQGRQVLDTAGNLDTLVAKYGPGGDLLWARTFHVSADGLGHHIFVDRAGRVWLVGYAQGQVDWDPGSGLPRLTSPGPHSWVLLQLSTEGNLCWAHLIRFPQEFTFMASAGLSPEGDLYLSGPISGRVEFDRKPGTMSLTSANAVDAFVAKYTVRGDCSWARLIEGARRKTVLTVGRDGNVVLAGQFEHRADFGNTVLTAPQESSYLAKVDRTGTFLWARVTGCDARVAVNRIAQDAAGHIYVTGDYWPGATIGGVSLADTNNISVYLARLDEQGTPLWVRSAKGSGENHANGLALDGAGHVYVSGGFRHQIDFDSSAGGDTRECRSPTDYNAFVWKVDEDGNHSGVWTIESNVRSSTVGLACDARHQVHAVGYAEGASQLMNLTSPGLHVYLAQFQPTAAEATSARYEHTSGISALAYAPDGRSLALGDSQRQVRIWEPAPAAKAPASLSHQPDECWAIAFSPDGNRLVSGGDNDKDPRNLKVWDVGTGQQLWSAAKHAALVSCVAYSPDGRLIAAGDYANAVRLWQAADGNEAALLEGHTGAVRCLAFSPDGGLLASGAQDHTIRVWDTGSGRLLQTLQGHTNNVRGLVFSPDGRWLVSASSDATARLWDVVSGRCTQVFDAPSGLHSVVLSRDGQELFAGSRSGQIHRWDLSTSQELPTLPGHTKEIRALALCSDGRTLASAGEDGTIMLGNPSIGLELLTLRGHTKAVNGLAFAPGGDMLVSACHDGTIGVWRAPAK